MDSLFPSCRTNSHVMVCRRESITRHFLCRSQTLVRKPQWLVATVYLMEDTQPLSIFQPLRPFNMSSQEFQEKSVNTKREISVFACHPEYYKEDGDFTILVENTLFKVGHSPLAVTTGLMITPRCTGFYCRATLQHLPTCSRLQWHLEYLVATRPTKAIFGCKTLGKN